MHVLLIKTSSLGDVIHTLPALTDAANALGDVHFDWVIEENFVQIPQWHPAVDRVIPIAIRRWRKSKFKSLRTGEVRDFLRILRSEQYDAVIDAQGLIKSALIARFSRGKRYGLSLGSAREPMAAMFYQQGIEVSRKRHAIERTRVLFSKALGYSCPDTPPQFGLQLEQKNNERNPPSLMFLHGTTWRSKQYPESFWIDLARVVWAHGYTVKLPWGNEEEHQRAKRIASSVDGVEVLPPLDLDAMATQIAMVTGVIAVDTGLAHLAAALAKPMVVLYSASSHELTGVIGENQCNLPVKAACSPCFYKNCRQPESNQGEAVCYESLPAEVVFSNLQGLISEARRQLLKVV